MVIFKQLYLSDLKQHKLCPICKLKKLCSTKSTRTGLKCHKVVQVYLLKRINMRYSCLDCDNKLHVCRVTVYLVFKAVLIILFACNIAIEYIHY